MSTVLDRVASVVTRRPEEVDPAVTKKLEKARARHNVWKPYWAEPLAFVEGRHFVFRSIAVSSVTLNELQTAEGGMKESWRARTVRNRVLDYWLSEVSSGTQRVPAYEVTPTSTDPDVISAARLGEKVLQYLYPKLEQRYHVACAFGYAVACGEGFVYPYWNGSVGDALPADPANPDEQLYEGELCLESLGPHEVAWEPGVRFEQSAFHIIERVMSIDRVKQMPGFTGVELKPDASGARSFVQGQLDKRAAQGDMVTVTEYLERPTKQTPEGRRLIIANKQVVVPEEPYPVVLEGPYGYEPCLHKISYISTPWRDRDMGLVEHLLDAQRTLNDSTNKSIDWKNLALVPRVITPAGMRDRITAEPGGVFRSKGPVDANSLKIIDVPPIPASLFQMREAAVEDMDAIASQRGVPPQVSSGKGLAAFTEQEQNRSQAVILGLSDFHSRLGKHLLYYVQQRYTEKRLLVVEGRHGADYIPDFKGADLKDQIAVRVLPGSIEPLTRAAVEQRIMNFAQLGWISKEEGVTAINGGTAEGLIEEFELNVQRQWREIHQMIAMGDERLPGGEVPIAQPYDNHDVHLTELHKWMLTREFEGEPEPVQEAARLHEQQHTLLKEQDQAKAVEQQAQQAEQMGMNNATRAPAAQKPLPSLPSLNGQ